MSRLLYRFLVGLARLAVRSGRSKDLEIIVLRHQVAVLTRRADRPALTDEDRWLLGAIGHALPRAGRLGWIVTADTVLRWHRRRIARHWTQPTRGRGRPPTTAEIRQLALQMAAENPTWGYRRIFGELSRLGYRVGASTVWRILHNAGIDPAPDRATVTWSAFLKSQAAVACDFATIDTALLRRYYLLFFIDIQTRTVIYAGITAHPTAAWTTQAARNLFVRRTGTLAGCKALVRDRAAQFTASFDEIFATEDIKVLKTPVRVPVANSFAKRWIGTLRRELLDRTIIWNRRQLERLVTDYIDHDNGHRPHRSLNQRPPQPVLSEPSADPPPRNPVIRTTRCDGLIHEYRNTA